MILTFEQLGLCEGICKAVLDSGYRQPTPVQEQAIGPALQGQDLMVSSRTGSGKTAAFILPALQRLRDAASQPDEQGRRGRLPWGRSPRVLVLTPTRELAQQVSRAAITYGRQVPELRVATVLGGMPYAQQLRTLRNGIDILVATPGRLLDHLGSGKLSLDRIEMLILDEADRMLDMGFIDDIRAIAMQTPAKRQTMMFSATFDGHAGKLASELLREPVRITVESHTEANVNIEQRLHWADDFTHKQNLLDHLLTLREIDQALVFTSTQVDVERLAQRLEEQGHAVAALHGGMPQGRRNRMLMMLRQGRVRVLVATDVAARGIDVPAISHVINFGLPMKAEDYVHRIGRTGRAGRQGLAITLAERRDQHLVRRIEQFTASAIPVTTVLGLEPTRAAPSNRGTSKPVSRSGPRGATSSRSTSRPKSPAPRRADSGWRAAAGRS